MIRNFYNSLIGLRYSLPLTLLALCIFGTAYLKTRTGNSIYTTLLIAVAIVLACVMIRYYSLKYKLGKTIKGIDNIAEYDKAGMVKNSFILEDRMLVCSGLNVAEEKTDNIQKITYEDTRRAGKLLIQTPDKQYSIDVLNKDEASRLTALLKRKNPEVQLENIEPSGNGTLKELGGLY